LPDTFTPQDLQLWAIQGGTDWTNSQGKVVKGWRLRKTILAACYTGVIAAWVTATNNYSTWADGAGIIMQATQMSSYGYKNCGLMFGGLLPQGDPTGTTTTADFSEAVDQTWVCGKYQFPGGCSPTYTFRFAAQASIGRFPWIVSGTPLLFGYPFCVYTVYQDQKLMMLDRSNVNDN